MNTFSNLESRIPLLIRAVVQTNIRISKLGKNGAQRARCQTYLATDDDGLGGGILHTGFLLN